MSMFQIGDVVGLKAGGPPMTVSRFYEGSVSCQWFSRDDLGKWGELQEGIFPAEGLRKMVPLDGGKSL